MLSLMTNYRECSKRTDLDATIEFLTNTSKLVECFTSNQRVRSRTDKMLGTIAEVLQWWKDWSEEEGCNSKTNYITRECHEDLMSMLLGFARICINKINYSPLGSICPSRISSDIVENFFCCQRSLNGCTTNPTYLQFSKSVNTLIITQNSLSKKGNAATKVTVGGATPYKMYSKKSFRGIRV